jgi:hypothetical protein
VLQKGRFIGSWLGHQRRRLPVRVLAALLALLAASPFTAPFSACRLSVLLTAPGLDSPGLPASGPALMPVSEDSRGYPAQSIIEEHSKDDAVAQQSWVIDHGAGVFRVIVSLRVTPHSAHAAPAVLRI